MKTRILTLILFVSSVFAQTPNRVSSMTDATTAQITNGYYAVDFPGSSSTGGTRRVHFTNFTAQLSLGGATTKLDTNNGTAYGLKLGDLTTGRAMIVGAAGNPTNSAVTTSTELGYVSGVTSAIQTQMDAKAPLASPTFTGTPTIPSFASSTHTHQNAAGGGTLDAAAIVAGTLAKARGGFAADNSSGYSVSGTNGTLTGNFSGNAGTFTNGLTIGAGSASPVTITMALGGNITNAGNSVGLTNYIPHVFNSNATFNATLTIGSGSGLARLSSGVVSAADLTGDITTSGGVATTIANNAVTSAKIADGTITGPDIGNGEVNTGQIADFAVQFGKIQATSQGGVVGRTLSGSGAVTALAALPWADTGDVTRPTDSKVTTIANDAVTYAKMQNISATQRVLGRNTAAAGDTEEVTFTQFLDWVGSAAQGDILYRNGSAWTRLGAGTSGHYLQTQGAGANPQWAAVSSGGLASTDIDTSAELRAIVTDESGTGALIFAGGAIGAATATTASALDNDTSVATTAFVQTELGSSIVDITKPPYNAVGDDSTDNTTAVQAAVLTGKAVLIPAGIFRFGPVIATNGTVIFGPGTVRMKAATTGWIIDSGSNTNVTVRDITVDHGDTADHGYPTDSTVGTVHGIRLWTATGKAKAINVKLRNIDGYGITLDGEDDITTRRDRGQIFGCDAYNVQTAYHFAQTNRAEYCSIIGSDARKCYYGFNIGSANYTVSGCVFVDTSVQVRPTSGNGRSHGVISATTINHGTLTFQDASTGATITGCNILGSSGLQLLATTGAATAYCIGVTLTASRLDNLNVEAYAGETNLIYGNFVNAAITYSGTTVPMNFDNWYYTGGEMPNTVSKTSAYTLKVVDSKRRHNNTGATAKVAFTLPAAAAGLVFPLDVTDSDGIDVISVGDDKIGYGTTISGTAATIASTTVGSTIVLRAVSSTQWVADTLVGTWTP